MSFELQPILEGPLLTIRPLIPGDFEELCQAASDPLIWEVHPAKDRYKRDVFQEYFDEALACGGGFAIVDRRTQKIVGSSRYYELYPEAQVEIGYTFMTREYWGGLYNRELKKLMLDHAFRFVKRVVFSVGELNFRSQKAMLKIGGVKAGIEARLRKNGLLNYVIIYKIEKDTNIL